jgi:tRNA threonylcarbamoyladenosine biosynthesis protein TsaE
VAISTKVQHFSCPSEDDLFELGRTLASQLPTAVTLLLRGTLGAGKTLLSRGIVDFFEIPPTMVTSPSFSIINDYMGTIPIRHLDLYRITSQEAWHQLGVDEELGRKFIIIEWPQLIEGSIPLPKVDIQIIIGEDQTREVEVTWYLENPY